MDGNSQLTGAQLAAMIDHTNLKAFATDEDIEKLCQEAIQYQFASVCVNPSYVKLVSEKLAGSGVTPCSVIAFPLGQLSIQEKVSEAKLAMQDGARELDYVLNVGQVKRGNLAYIREEMQAMCDTAHDNNCRVKVIFETCYLTKEEIRAVAEIAREVKPDFIKTSTGFGTGGATEEDVRLMRQTVGEDVGVKASGGIRTREDALRMISAGADRIGASAGIAICS